MIMLAGALLSVLGATQVWTETSLVNVFPDSVPIGESRSAIRLYAAQGEAESFQICIRGDRKGTQVSGIEPKPLDKQIGAPHVYSVGYVTLDKPPRAELPQVSQWPDPLMPVVPVDIPPGQTRAFWVTYSVPHDAKPGVHKGRLDIELGKGPKLAIEVTVEVFAFAQPTVPTYRALFPLDRTSLSRVYGLDDDRLDAWKPIYNAVTDARVSASLWDGGSLVKVEGDKVDSSLLKAHIECAAADGMGAINLGSSHDGIEPFLAGGSEGAGALQAYLQDMHAWLDAKGWFDRACVYVMDLPPRESWVDARNASFRVKRADPDLPRLIAARPNPYLERYTDILAMPLSDAHPIAIGRLREGLSLAAQPAHIPTRITASSYGPPAEAKAFTSLPEDAYDGCLFTYWYSAAPPTRDNPQWLEIVFDEPVKTESFAIGWKTGFESTDIDVFCAYGGENFSSSRVRWEHKAPASPFDNSWSEGKFRFNKTFRAIRLLFRDTVGKGPVAIGELEFGAAPSPRTIEKIKPLAVWLDASRAATPGLGVATHPVEARFVPWACWGWGMSGLLGQGLVSWPIAWTPDTETAQAAWQGAGDGGALLMYPNATGPAPSIRLERLRDGIDDYEYLTALEQAVNARRAVDPSVARLCQRNPYRKDLSVGDLGALARTISDGHVRIGRALTTLAASNRTDKKKQASQEGPTPAEAGPAASVADSASSSFQE